MQSDFIPVYLTLHIDCSRIEDVHRRCRSKAEFDLVQFVKSLLTIYGGTCFSGDMDFYLKNDLPLSMLSFNVVTSCV